MVDFKVRILNASPVSGYSPIVQAVLYDLDDNHMIDYVFTESRKFADELKDMIGNHDLGYSEEWNVDDVDWGQLDKLILPYTEYTISTDKYMLTVKYSQTESSPYELAVAELLFLRAELAELRR